MLELRDPVGYLPSTCQMIGLARLEGLRLPGNLHSEYEQRRQRQDVVP